MGKGALLWLKYWSRNCEAQPFGQVRPSGWDCAKAQPLTFTLGIVMIPRYFAIAILCSVSASPAVASETANASAISTLGKAQPSVRWDEKSVVVADITCDGKPDQIAVGYGQDESVWVGLIQRGGHPITMQFPVGKHSQNSLCSTPVHLETSSLVCSDEEMGDLPGCKEVKGCSAFSVVDDSCDSFHFYWNASRKKLVWWRR